MKIYTKAGDDGTTDIGNQTRVLKCDIRIEVIGTLDELNAMLGFLLSQNEFPEQEKPLFQTIQTHLFELGTEISIPYAQTLHENIVQFYEEAIDHIQAQLPLLHHFIIPGGSSVVAILHLARTICRRAERRLVELYCHDHTTHSIPIQFLNRLSDFLFVFARYLLKKQGIQETRWD